MDFCNRCSSDQPEWGGGGGGGEVGWRGRVGHLYIHRLVGLAVACPMAVDVQGVLVGVWWLDTSRFLPSRLLCFSFGVRSLHDQGRSGDE